MRTRLLFILILFLGISIYAQQARKTSTPNWVTPVEVKLDTTSEDEGAFKYLLLDYQDNLIDKEQFAHYAFKILNTDGIQEMSDISTSYDPAFQKLEFHKAQVIRNGTIIDKLENAFINTYQRETNLERSLYDGSLTSVINLSDIRVGDIIEYSYTIKGFNPINKGNYSNLIYQEYTLPVNRIYSRILTDSKNSISFKLLNGAAEPKIQTSSFGKEYIWNSENNAHVIYESNVPYWFNTQKRISVSTFKNWESVVDLLTPYYKISKEKLTTPISIDAKLDSKQDVIIKLIRFVQDEIRYLGFESGVGAFKPNDPKIVLNRRYGDCKDKSLLLSTLLQDQGVTSYPILVNSESNKNLDVLLPSHEIFNHCIVYFEHDGKEYFVDPTISNQGGNLYNLNTPNYTTGLILKDDSNKLKEIPESTKAKVRIVEDIVIDSIGGNAEFEVKTEYYRSKADYMRSYFKSNTEESINKDYLTFYSNLYPTITSANKISHLDDSRPWENIFTTTEYYDIENIWHSTESDETMYLDTNALVLDGLINYTNSLKREMPYSAGAPFSFSQTTRILLPEPWNIFLKDINIDNEYYSFSKNIELTGNLVTLNYAYELKKEVIPASDTPTFLKEHEDIRDSLGVQLTYADNGMSETGISWLSILIMLVSLAISSFFALKIYKNYNPEKEEGAELPGQAIGGWLILPIIGLSITPFVILYQIYLNQYFDATIWDGFELGGYENIGLLNLYLGFELFYNFAFLTFTILTLFMLFNKRTATPKMMIIFYSCNLTVIILESIFMNQVGIPDPTAANDIIKVVIASAIWIPYFLNSTRVKSTFVNTYDANKLNYLANS
ncbi:DUF3857 domain-containing protein [Maribacter hydrothermalis]|uniref:DUF3857 domain-containing protein n=1 Tax=Maribacter hydrothermalis TaxID=1836467 RepID=A0A1B7Z3K8_9FLAO|nr:DUF3857 domain-containing protein [Maribacter hydrothermalis]APQ17003.1 hypothetical protein BTR34_06560 [Maribacter hydrothermalis]OBR37264.1 hypothetical protein A9200_06320 [Maribacter hydrothermalis]